MSGLIVLPRINRDAAKARLGVQNLLTLGAVTASSEAANFSVRNCFDGNTADYFRPAVGGGVTIDLVLDQAMTADYMAFYNQDLSDFGGNIKLQYNDGTGYVDASQVVAPTDNKPRMVFFDAKTADRWRVVIDCTEVFNLGVLSFGQYLGFPRGMYLGWTPPALANATRLLSSVSQGGALLGRSRIPMGFATSLNLNNAPDAWVYANWPGFREHAEKTGFFFAPNVALRPDDACYCWVDGEQIPPPVHVHYGYMSASIPIRGAVE